MIPTNFSAPAKIILLLLQFLAVGTFAQSQLQSPIWNVENIRRDASPVKIHVKEGTWMNLDISPDGSRIVFDLLGDIYSIPATGGIGTPLTSDLAWQMQPSFSPDGNHIVYTSDEGGGENIWIMDRDGNHQTEVTFETFRMLNSPAWGPDGNYIAARKHFTGTRSLGAGEIWLYHKNGGKGCVRDVIEQVLKVQGKWDGQFEAKYD